MPRQIRSVVAFFFLCGALSAQTTTGEISGRVTDGTGAVIPAASIRIVNAETGTRRDTVTNESGVYIAPALLPGVYQVTVQKEGFKPQGRSSIELAVDQVARIDFQLEVGAVTDSVQVTAQAPLLDEDTTSMDQSMDSAKILEMPLNGRSSFRLVQLMPNVLGAPSSNGQFGDIPVNTMDDSILSIGGGRAKTNELLIDGIPSTTGFVNQITTIPNVDATREFKVQHSSLSAEFGRFTGGVINVSTRSGGNSLRGSLYEFLRNDALDANQFFNNRAGQPTPVFHMNQYGFAVGGPVYLPKLCNGRNRTFFFTDFQGTRWRQGQVSFFSVPSEQQKNGNFTQTFNRNNVLIVIYDPMTTTRNPNNTAQYIRTAFPGNVLPASRLNKVTSKMVAFYPEANTTGAAYTNANNFVTSAPRAIEQANQSVRADHNISQNNRFFARFSANRSTLTQPDPFNNPASPTNGVVWLNNYTGGMDDTVVLTPQSVLNVRYGYARFFWYRPTRGYGFDQRTVGMPSSLVSQMSAPLFPIMNPDDVANLGSGTLLHTAQDTHSLLVSLTKLVGKHNIKFGYDSRLRRLNGFNLSGGGGTYNFTRAMTQGPNPNTSSLAAGYGLATLLLGTATGGSINTAAATAIQNYYIAGYIQDNIRLSRKLTLNIGLRYETEHPYTERHNQLNRWEPATPNPAANAMFPNLVGALGFASDKDRTVYRWDINNIAPRIGLAWSLAPKTVFRAGGGMFYAPFGITNSDTGLVPAMGYSSTSSMVNSLDGVTPYNLIDNPFPDGLTKMTRNSLGAATYLGQGLTIWDPDAVTPYSFQWNTNLQRLVARSMVLDVSYTGNHGVKQNYLRGNNALDPKYLALGTATQTLVANPFYGLITNGALALPTVAQRQLLLPNPEYVSVSKANGSWGNGNYHAMAVKMNKHFSAGVNFLFTYTVGKLISDVPTATSTYDNGNNAGMNTSVQNWYNLRAERSLSEMDVSQQLNFSCVFELPFGKGKPLFSKQGSLMSRMLGGWQVSGIVTRRSGIPLVLGASVTGGATRPNSTGTSGALPRRSHGEMIQEWFDTSQYTIPAAWTLGNVSRTLPDVRGPALTNLDASLTRYLKIREGLRLQVRAEAFNATNTPHFWQPTTGIANAQFGQISNTTGMPRVMQGALKLLF